MTQNDWSTSLAAAIAEQVRRLRKERGMSAQQLADACTDLGLPITRSAVANLESQRRPTVSVAELLIFARALDTPPILLLIPLGQQETVKLAPEVTAATWDAVQWFAGLGPTSGETAVRLFLRHDRFVREYTFSARKAASAHAMHEGTADENLRAAHAATAQAADRAATIAEEIITEVRDDIRSRGLTPPPLPPELAHLA
ncbi:helix-turn-helix domain-containing protein [Actinomadura rudentiformis]|uniref:Helix-turn-helix transcriptional regulator n=1 Tax=Actinomadura rudentiformis TaxID=359158 RepID=A0A6H9YI81_9ACTN|nr:helix-turn-helix transcriptional regulator [Actinomadura rudentiformis]KAB2344917.1 helix-turn-helix transcriptional regulator [Actinomadura rudentiformis]